MILKKSKKVAMLVAIFNRFFSKGVREHFFLFLCTRRLFLSIFVDFFFSSSFLFCFLIWVNFFAWRGYGAASVI